MRSEATSPEAYLAELPKDRKVIISRLRETIKLNLPAGFDEVMSYGMIGYVVPHKIYPSGYHCDTSQPLPFINLASQKNYVALYHMGIYSNDDLLKWFREEYSKYVPTKLDMGKSCIRFKNMDNIPFELIGRLCTKITVDEWIATYEFQIKKSKKN